MKFTDIPHFEQLTEFKAADNSYKWENIKAEQSEDLIAYYKDVRVRKFKTGTDYKNVRFFEVATAEGSEIGIIPSMFISFCFITSILVWNAGADKKEICIVWDNLPDEEIPRIKSMYKNEDVIEWYYNPESKRIRLTMIRKPELPAGDAPSQSK